MQIKLGEQIKAFRHKDGRTQEELATALGVTAQAVSRWETGICYPDMELMPPMANYFGVTIDELFGYDDRRTQRIDALAEQIIRMNRENNGIDVNIDACIRLAREALIEFPGNEKLTYCLASVLYNAGYVRYGEFHLIDREGYNVYDVCRHREYAEWQEAIKLYEKLLATVSDGTLRYDVIRELMQLYLNTGEREKALAIAETAPDIDGSKPFLRTNACDGKEKAKACSEAVLETVHTCAEVIIGTVLSYEQTLSPAEKVRSIRSAIHAYDLICDPGEYGRYHGFIARMYTLLSLYLWLDGKKDEAFEALEDALTHGKAFEDLEGKDVIRFHSPLLRLVTQDPPEKNRQFRLPESLAEDWPWWSVQEYSLVIDDIQADPRWDAWVQKTKNS